MGYCPAQLTPLIIEIAQIKIDHCPVCTACKGLFQEQFSLLVLLFLKSLMGRFQQGMRIQQAGSQCEEQETDTLIQN